ncbi:MAG: hypothetical protein ACK5M3_16665 [Dysgonomonas sp.]
MRKLFFILPFLFLVCSCSDDDIVTPTDPNDANFVKVKMGVTKKESNIFEKLQFTMYSSLTDKPVFISGESIIIADSYDSLVWAVPELGRQRKVLTNIDYDFDLISSWAFVFYVDGKYHTTLHGYKNGKIILADTVAINVTNGRDILGYNWKDITTAEADLHWQDFFKTDYGIYTRKRIYEGFPSLKIDFLPDWNAYTEKKEKKDFCEKEQEKFAYDYITSLYGKPKLSHIKDGATIVDTYKNTFKRGDISLAPRYIWETNASRIVLLQTYGEEGEWNSYFVYAEPK